MYDFFISHPEIMRYSSLSALNVADKQDPSLVTDISRLHEVFTHYGYAATGMYFKALHYLCVAFLDKSLDPYERVYKAWWCKTFFVVWDLHKNSTEDFVTTETYRDIVCACDGLVMYLELLRKKFPDAIITTYYLGSDQNEQLYAFIRVSFSHGRSRNLDAITIAYGAERRNVWSELSLSNDSSVIAHTRGRTVLRPELEITNADDPEPHHDNSQARIWRGSDIDKGSMLKAMNRATKDCILEGKRLNLGVFLDEEDPTVRAGRKIHTGSHEPSSHGDEEQDSGEEDDALEPEGEPSFEGLDLEDELGHSSITTKQYGTLPFRAAEPLLLNGGRSSISTKSRKGQFTGDVFGIESDIRMYRQSFCGCRGALQIGQSKTLPTFANSKKRVYGEVRYISYSQSPMKFYCKTHSIIKSVPNVWVFSEERKYYVRCSFI